MRTLFAILILAASLQDETPFHGIVVDADGKPVAEARVDTYWAVADGKLVPRAGTRTDAEGKFKIGVRLSAKRPSIPIMAVDKEGARGAAIPLDAEHPRRRSG
jgi:hypothetical protein